MVVGSNRSKAGFPVPLQRAYLTRFFFSQRNDL